MPAKKRKKSWREKLAEAKDLPKVVRLDAAGARRLGGKTLAIGAPRDVDALMRQVPAGKVTTINELRTALAKKQRANVACPITTGIFSWIAAHAAEEAQAAGEADPTPYWRTLRKDGELNAKYPGGIAGLRRRLAAERHAFTVKGKRILVRDYERVLFSPR
jgi:alkylated DNA nucleotide flippase Atl1